MRFYEGWQPVIELPVAYFGNLVVPFIGISSRDVFASVLVHFIPLSLGFEFENFVVAKAAIKVT